jgi:hypothetical protein
VAVHQCMQVGALEKEVGFASATAQRVAKGLNSEYVARKQGDLIGRPIRLGHAAWAMVGGCQACGRLGLRPNSAQVVFDACVATVKAVIVAQSLEHTLRGDIWYLTSSAAISSRQPSSLAGRGAREAGSASAEDSVSRFSLWAVRMTLTVLRLTPVLRAMARILIPWRDNVTA